MTGTTMNVDTVNDDGLWKAVAGRDARADGLFVYAVTTTRVYCRPSCASRRPRRDHVRFFPAPAMAEGAGYRACRRCRPDVAQGDAGVAPALARVRQACEAVARRPAGRWTAGALARAGGVSRVQLQRAFRGVLGVSPREYVAACRHRQFLAALRNGHRVTDAIYEAGYGSPSRVYGSIHLPGMTPATYGRGGRGAAIRWLTTASPVGRILVAATARGLCAVRVGSNDEDLRKSLRDEFPLAEIDTRPSASLAPLANAARAVAEARPVPADLPLDIRGTAFQWRVWRALTRIPAGQTRSYAEVARSMGRPTAVRAVARACATNPIALVVPCHRVVSSSGRTGGYRWGAETKAKLIAAEQRQGSADSHGTERP
jgi:AraC family transcriptional regulator, regulatory protein of adaptative response / methylated-DNA-[protein]-cysteine methyltransferase